MTKNPFDQFSKQFFEEFLSPYGEVKINDEVPGEPTSYIDIYFLPTVKPTQIPESLGLLRRIASTPCLIEPYRNQPSFDEVESCLHKLFAVRKEYRRDAKRNDRTKRVRVLAIEYYCDRAITKVVQDASMLRLSEIKLPLDPPEDDTGNAP